MNSDLAVADGYGVKNFDPIQRPLSKDIPNLISKDSIALTEVCSDRDKLNLNFPQDSRIYLLRSVIRISII